jgi:hypothetical protein
MIVIIDGRTLILFSSVEIWSLLALIAARETGAPVFGPPSLKLLRAVRLLMRRGVRVRQVRDRRHHAGGRRQFVLLSAVKVIGPTRTLKPVRHRPTDI